MWILGLQRLIEYINFYLYSNHIVYKTVKGLLGCLFFFPLPNSLCLDVAFFLSHFIPLMLSLLVVKSFMQWF